MCIKLVIKTNLYYDARTEKHQNSAVTVYVNIKWCDIKIVLKSHFTDISNNALKKKKRSGRQLSASNGARVCPNSMPVAFPVTLVSPRYNDISQFLQALHYFTFVPP
jgi:hypothetical protein